MDTSSLICRIGILKNSVRLDLEANSESLRFVSFRSSFYFFVSWLTSTYDSHYVHSCTDQFICDSTYNENILQTTGLPNRMSGALTYKIKIFADYWITKADERCVGMLKLTGLCCAYARGEDHHKQVYG